MAGKNSIQFLRGTEANLQKNSDLALLDGQPLYDKTNNWLYVGNDTKTGNTISTAQTISMDFNQDALTAAEVEGLWKSNSGTSSPDDEQARNYLILDNIQLNAPDYSGTIATEEHVETRIGQDSYSIEWLDVYEYGNKLNLSGALITFDTSTTNSSIGQIYNTTLFRSSGGYELVVDAPPSIKLKTLDGQTVCWLYDYYETEPNEKWRMNQVVLPKDFGYVTSFPGLNSNDACLQVLETITSNITLTAKSYADFNCQNAFEILKSRIAQIFEFDSATNCLNIEPSNLD